MQFDVLGPMRVGWETQPVPLAGRLRQGLLGVLLSRANTPVAAEELIDALWGPQTTVSHQRLQTGVHKLRRALGETERVSFGPGGYVLRVGPGELDAQRFDDLLDEAAATDDLRHRSRVLRESLALWRGEPYQGIDVALLTGEAQRLTERRLLALEHLYTAELASGQDGAIVPELNDLVQQYPLRERLQELLMTALHRGGRRADALAAYRQARSTMVEELGLEPGPQLRELERIVLAGDPDPLATVGPHARPAQLPHDPPGFVGRVDERAELDRGCADATVGLVTITGTAGVGKTALAVHWAHGVRDRFEDGQLFIDLRGHGREEPVTAADALVAFLRAMGVDETRIPREEAQRAALFRTMTDDKQMLVVLDNAADERQVRPLLPGSRSCCVVVTSRNTLTGLTARDGAHMIELERMTHDEAARLVVDRHPAAAADPISVADLVEHCARLPLALLVAAERIAGQPSRPLSELVTDLDTPAGALEVLDNHADEHSSVRAVLSWSYDRLTPEAARLFRMSGFHCMHPGHHLDPHSACAAVDSDDVVAATRALTTLERVHLVESVGDGRYQMHNLLHAFAREMGEGEENPQAAIDRLIGYNLGMAITAMRFLEPREVEPRSRLVRPKVVPILDDHSAATRWLDANLATVLCISEASADSGWHDQCIDVSTTLWRYLDLHDHLDAAHQVHTRARSAARATGDRIAQGVAVRALGVVELRWGRHDAAEAHLLEACCLQDRDPERELLGITLGYLAALYAAVGADEDVLCTVGRARELLSRTGSVHGLARPLELIGLAYAERGEHPTASRYLRQAAEGADGSGSGPVTAPTSDQPADRPVRP